MKTNEIGYVFILTLAPLLSFFALDPSSSYSEGSSFTLPHPQSEADETARSGIRAMEELVKSDKKLVPLLGFHSADEATKANMRLGQGLPIMGIHIDRLKQYSSDRDPTSLFKAADQFIYPIIVDGKIKNAITVRKSSRTGRWLFAFGAVGAPLAAEELKLLNSAFIVRLYAMNQWFLGTSSGDQVKLISIKPNPSYKRGDPSHAMSIGKEENAGTVFAKLAEEAKNFNFNAYGARRHSKRE